MNTVFIGGSRHVSRLPTAVTERLDKVVASGHHVVVGDANGADKAVQRYLVRAQYNNVTVFCSGAKPRNNLGLWSVRPVSPPRSAKGFEYYAAKDREMARDADFGFMIWDGKSYGTVLNVLRLVRAGKFSVLFNVADKVVLNFKSMDQWQNFILEFDPEFRAQIEERATPDEWASDEAGSGPGLRLPLEQNRGENSAPLVSPIDEPFVLSKAAVPSSAAADITTHTSIGSTDDRSALHNEMLPRADAMPRTASSPILNYIRQGPTPEERRYWQSLLNEDDLGAVVRTSTFLESQIETILRRHFVDKTASINVRGIPYMRRVELAWALGDLDAEIVQVLRFLDNLRGSFAHNHAYEVDERTLSALLSAIRGHVRYIYEYNMKSTFAESSAEVRYATAHLAEPKRQLRAALDAIKTVVGMISRSSFDLVERVRERQVTP